MSEQRIPDKRWVVRNAGIGGKIALEKRKSTIFEAYSVGQFAHQCHASGRNFYPNIPAHRDARRKYAETMYRLRVNGRWYKPGGKSYFFMTLEEIGMILVGLKDIEEQV